MQVIHDPSSHSQSVKSLWVSAVCAVQTQRKEQRRPLTALSRQQGDRLSDSQMIGLHCKRFSPRQRWSWKCSDCLARSRMNKSALNSRGWFPPGLIDETLPIVFACQRVLSTSVIVKAREAVVMEKTNSDLQCCHTAPLWLEVGQDYPTPLCPPVRDGQRASLWLLDFFLKLPFKTQLETKK